MATPSPGVQYLFDPTAASPTGTAVGAGAAFPSLHTDTRYTRNERTCYCFGTFGGSTVTVEASPDYNQLGASANWIPITNVSFTAAGMINFDVAADAIRGRITGGSGMSVTLIVY
jgi:hypothetical protein